MVLRIPHVLFLDDWLCIPVHWLELRNLQPIPVGIVGGVPLAWQCPLYCFPEPCTHNKQLLQVIASLKSLGPDLSTKPFLPKVQ